MPNTPTHGLEAAIEAKLVEHERKGTLVYYAPPDAFVEERNGYRISLVRAGEDCHRPTGTWPYTGAPGEKMPYFFGPSLTQAEEACAQLNERIGVSKEVAALIIARSISRGSPRAQRTSATERLARAIGVSPQTLAKVLR